MKKAHTVKALLNNNAPLDSSVTVRGWLRTRRDSKAGISFLHLYDGSCFSPIQAVAPKSLENYESVVLTLSTGCAVEITGTLVASKGKGQSVEIQATEVLLVGDIENPETYPMSKKHHSLEYLREVAHLRPRTNVIGAMTRVRNCLAQAVHRFFHQNGYYWISTPIITTNDCEGAGEQLRVSTLDFANLPKDEKGAVDFSEDFFGEETFVTVSGQLNAEAYCLALSKVYTFGPTFRAENSNTARHLAEFWMLEPEIAFADLNDAIQLADDLLKFVLKAVLEECPDDMAFFAERIDKTVIERLDHVIKTPIKIIEYSEAIALLEKADTKFEYPVSFEAGLQTEHERYLAETIFNGPVAVINYPKAIKAFYMRVNDDQKTVAATDVLVPGVGELIGGSQREERLEVLDQRMEALGVDKNKLQWYRDLRRYGSVPHAGFGLGFERLVNYVTGLNNIRDAIAFPRTPKNAKF